MVVKEQTFLFRLIRYISRQLVRFFGLNVSNFVVNIFLKYSDNSTIRYFYYFLSSKILKVEYEKSLQEVNFVGATRKKIEWANCILNFSSNEDDKLVARHYLWILSKFGYLNVSITDDFFYDELQNIRKQSDEKFYLYGPNSKFPPNLEYKDYTLVVTKDIEENTDRFRHSILFLNYMYYSAKIANDMEFKHKLLNKYNKIYISSFLPIQDKEFEHSHMLPSSELCGSMALGRVLYNLILKNGSFDCVIEGYDQYLSSDAYSKHYPTLIRKNNHIDEQKVVQSLADHDPLYNFLLVKELSNYVNFIKSSSFIEIANMTGNEYLEELASARDFRLL